MRRALNAGIALETAATTKAQPKPRKSCAAPAPLRGAYRSFRLERAHPLAGSAPLRGAYRSFRLERATSASRMEMIQKRTMIFGSAQPFFSKW